MLAGWLTGVHVCVVLCTGVSTCVLYSLVHILYIFRMMPQNIHLPALCFIGLLITAIVLKATIMKYWETGISRSFSLQGRSDGAGDREKFVNETCARLCWSLHIDTTDRQRMWRLLVDDKHKLLYCVIPKVACTSFKNYIAKATRRVRPAGRVSVHSVRYLNSLGLGYLSQPRTGNVRQKLASYFKFIVVRHPFDRLLSAYSDKFLKEDIFPKNYAKFISKEFGDGVARDDSGVVRLTFNQFVILVSKYYHLEFADRHWQSYYDLCHPCDIRYDKIIKLETIEDDLPSFTRRFLDEKTGTSPDFPLLNKVRNGTDKLAEVTSVFSAVDPSIVKALLEIYEKDFTLFGYTWSDQKGAGCVSADQKMINGC